MHGRGQSFSASPLIGNLSARERPARPVAEPMQIMTTTCYLAAGGRTETPAAFLEWASRAVEDARRSLPGGRLIAYVWPYRHGLGECLSCDVWYDAPGHGQDQDTFAITFVIDGKTDLRDSNEPHVLDMSDALHIAGIVLSRLDARITLGRPDNRASVSGVALAGARDDGNLNHHEPTLAGRGRGSDCLGCISNWPLHDDNCAAAKR